MKQTKLLPTNSLQVYNHFVPVAKGSVELVDPLTSSPIKIYAY